jgi:lysophospholipase L1-like esterase
VTARTLKFLADTSGLIARSNASTEQFQKFEEHFELLKKFNKPYLSKINRTIDELKRKGIYPIFVFTPRSEKNQYDEIIPLFNKIDAKYKIEIADSRKYPELYTVKNSADETHLNKKGAEIFTAILSQKFNELISKNKAAIIKK